MKKNSFFEIKKIMKKPFVEDVVYIFAGIFIAFMIYSILGFGLGTSKPVLTVVSGSMEPVLQVGDLIILKGVEPEDIVVGDIIVFNPVVVDKLIVHRVVEIIEENVVESDLDEFVVYSYRTKGDNNVTNQNIDPWIVHQKHVYGKYVFRIPYLGYPRIMLDKFFSFMSNI
jgi:signal peptidase I